MEPSSNQLPQNPPDPNVGSPQNVIVPQQPGPAGNWQQGLGTVNNPTQVSGVPVGPDTASQGAPTQYPQQNWQQPQQPFMQSANSLPSGGSKKKMLLIAGVVLVVAVLAGGAFFLFSKPGSNPDASKVAEQSSKSASAQTKDMSTLQNLSFVAPADMSAFTPKSVAGGKNVYATKDSVDTKACGFSFGVYSATELPGANINEILKPQLDNLKKVGVTIQGPTAGDPLVIKDASGASYSMPSLTFDMTKGTQHETDHYSISVLGNGERAVVQRSCANKNGPVDSSAFDVLEATAKKVTIKTQ